VDQTVARLGRIDILVANAGVWNIDDQPIEKMTEKTVDEMIRINLKSVYSVIHFASAHMIKQSPEKLFRSARQRDSVANLFTRITAQQKGRSSLYKRARDGTGRTAFW